MKATHALIFFLAIAIIYAINHDPNNDLTEPQGYQDGYAVTINTTCGIRSTMIHGAWNNEKYSKGYSRGAQAASSSISDEGCDKWK